MNKDLVKMQELKTEWKKLHKKALTEKTEKQMEDFCTLVKDTYDLFYDFVIAGEIPQEYVSLLHCVRKIARLPQTSGKEITTIITVVADALANWIKFYSIDEEYKKLEKGVVMFIPEFLLSRNSYNYYIYTLDFSEIQCMFEEMNNKELLVYKELLWGEEDDLARLRAGISYEVIDHKDNIIFNWDKFTKLARYFAFVFDYYDNKFAKGTVEIDKARIAMELYAFAVKKNDITLAENRYGYKTAQAIAYALSQIFINDFSHQKRKKYDPDNLVVHTVNKFLQDVVMGTIDAHTFNISKEFIQHCEFFECVESKSFVIDSVEVVQKRETTPFNLYVEIVPVYTYEIKINSKEHIDTDDDMMNYYLKDNALYVGFYRTFDGISFDVKTQEKFDKIYLTDGEKDILIWESQL